MQFLHFHDHLSYGDGFRVTLDCQANVRLMDDSNFAAYRSGRSDHYYVGLQKRSPAVLAIPHSGHWHLVIDLGGYSGQVRAGVQILKAA